MNYALLDPQIIYENNSDFQIVQYIETVRGPFSVAPPSYWIECTNENVIAYEWYYNVNDEIFYEIPQPNPIDI